MEPGGISGHDGQAIKLSARGVRKVFGQGKNAVTAIDDVTLDIESNAFITLVGTSGCGKSTFLNIVAGLDELSEGELIVDGRPVTGPGLDRGMVFQAYSLFPWLNVLKNVEFALAKTKIGRKERTTIARYYIAEVGLTGFESAYPNQLSGGMQQRVAIARALAYKPQLLLMDEPFGALDAETRSLMQEFLLRIWEQHKITMLFITHDVEEAVFLSDRIYVMTARPGRIKAIVPVPLARPRGDEVRVTPEFTAIKARVHGLIREESLRGLTRTTPDGSRQLPTGHYVDVPESDRALTP